MVKGADDALGVLWVTLRDSGARLGEIANIRAMDIDAGECCVRIRPYGEHKLKTKNSERSVPLSPKALVGLVSLAAIVRGREASLFPKYAGGRKPDNASAAMMKRLRTVIDDKKKTVHSLRHRMTDRLRNTGCPESVRKEIQGHDNQGVAFNYGEGYALSVKRQALEKVWET